MTELPRLASSTLKRLAPVICGDALPDRPESPYRTFTALKDFFAQDLQLTWEPAMEVSRAKTVIQYLQHYNGAPELARIIEASVRPADYTGPNCNLSAAVDHLNSILATEGFRLVPSGRAYSLVSTADPVMPAQTVSDALSDEYVQELSNKCETRLAAGDLDGAITNARTLLEAVLFAIQEDITGTRGAYDGDLPKQFKAVAKLLRMDDKRPDLDARFKDVVRGLTMAVSGLAPLRNKMSDSHPRERKPVQHHARLVVNAAKTVAWFLLDSYRVQRENNLLPDPHT